MKTEQILKQLAAAGVALTLAGDKLQVTGTPAKVEELAPMIREHKTALVAWLSGPGPRWCRQHQEHLLTAGWTEKELFNSRWPLGLATLGVFERPGVTVTLEAGKVVFVIPRPNGTTVQQVARPQSSLFSTIH